MFWIIVSRSFLSSLLCLSITPKRLILVAKRLLLMFRSGLAWPADEWFVLCAIASAFQLLKRVDCATFILALWRLSVMSPTVVLKPLFFTMFLSFPAVVFLGRPVQCLGCFFLFQDILKRFYDPYPKLVQWLWLNFPSFFFFLFSIKLACCSSTDSLQAAFFLLLLCNNNADDDNSLIKIRRNNLEVSITNTDI